MRSARPILLLLSLFSLDSAAAAQPTKDGPEFQVNVYTTNEQADPTIGLADSGDFVITWSSRFQDGSGDGVFARRYDSDGNPLNPIEFQVNTYTLSYQNGARIGMAPSGDFVIVWTGLGPYTLHRQISARRYTNSGDPVDAEEFVVSTQTTTHQDSPSVDVAASGDFVVAWDAWNSLSLPGTILGRRYDSAGAALDSQEFQASIYTTGFQVAPSIAVAPSGDFVAVWGSPIEAGYGFDILGRRYDSAGNPLSPVEFKVNTYAFGDQNFPDVAVSGTGAFVVVWQDETQDGSGSGIFARRFSSTGAAFDLHEFQVNSYTSGSQHNPAVAAAENGDFVVTWTDPFLDGSAGGAFGRRFGSAGNPIDPVEFLVNSYTSGSQGETDVAMEDADHFIVAWTSSGQDGSQRGVFAQRFSCSPGCDVVPPTGNIVLMSPEDGDTVDCRTPGIIGSRPLVSWDPGDYDAFRAQISWDPSFSSTQTVTSGKKLLTRTWWKPGKKAWRRACRKAGAEVYVRVFGVDRDLSKSDPDRKSFSDVVTANVLR